MSIQLLIILQYYNTSLLNCETLPIIDKRLSALPIINTRLRGFALINRCLTHLCLVLLCYSIISVWAPSNHSPTSFILPYKAVLHAFFFLLFQAIEINQNSNFDPEINNVKDPTLRAKYKAHSSIL